MALDGFLQIKRGGATAILGETLDKYFSDKDAISINSFEFGSGAAGAAMDDSTDDEDEDENEDEEGGEKKPGTAKDNKDKAEKKKDGKLHGEKKKKKKRKNWSFEVTKEVDSATPQLFEAYCENADEEDSEPYTAKVVLRKAHGKNALQFLELTFYKVKIISFELKSESDKLPKETVAFSFKKCKFRYAMQKHDGTSKPNEKTWNWEKPDQK